MKKVIGCFFSDKSGCSICSLNEIPSLRLCMMKPTWLDIQAVYDGSLNGVIIIATAWSPDEMDEIIELEG